MISEVSNGSQRTKDLRLSRDLDKQFGCTNPEILKELEETELAAQSQEISKDWNVDQEYLIGKSRKWMLTPP